MWAMQWLWLVLGEVLRLLHSASRFKVCRDALGRIFAESQNISEHLRRKKQLWPHWFNKSTIHFAVSLRILLLYDAEKNTMVLEISSYPDKNATIAMLFPIKCLVSTCSMVKSSGFFLDKSALALVPKNPAGYQKVCRKKKEQLVFGLVQSLFLLLNSYEA